MAGSFAAGHSYNQLLRMKFSMYLSQVLVGHMRIHLGRINTHVSKERLYTADVGTILEKIGREAVPNDVRCHLACDAGGDSVALDEPLHCAW